MPRPTHYVPEIRRPIVCALYHEAKKQRVPMTKLVNRLLENSLKGSVGWQKAQAAMSRPENQTAVPPGK